MDTLTHAISGAVLGTATGSNNAGEFRRRALWGALFAAFPDIDIVMALLTDHFTYLNEHRGYTHSIILLPLWAALLGWIGAMPWRPDWRARWRDMALLAAAVLAAHILGDLITSYGTKVFKPVYDAPLAFPITFIIDPIFTFILLAGVVAALWKKRVLYAAISGGVLLAYLCLQLFAQQWAEDIGRKQALAIGVPDAPVVVFPQPLSPFNWKIVVVQGETYHRAYVNLLEHEPRVADTDANSFSLLRAAYQPVDAATWKEYPRWPRDAEYRAVAYEAWSQEAFEGFREFALLPYVTSMRGDERNVCVWFTDLRFTLSGMQLPFEYAMCRRPGGEWVLEMDRGKKGAIN